MKITFAPKTKQGKYSVIFIIVSVLLVALIIIISSNSDPAIVNNGFFGNPLPASMVIGAFLSAAVSLITGLFAVIKNKERSVIVFICIIVSAFFVYFGIAQIVGEITNSH